MRGVREDNWEVNQEGDMPERVGVSSPTIPCCLLAI